MAINIHIPTPLRPFVNDQDIIKVDDEGSVAELLDQLTTDNKDLKNSLFHDDGKLRNFVNVYVNDEDIRYQQGPDTQVKSGDTISIVPSIAGG